ncbi:unnamed protein product [Ilex paraguariensis]|uniref:Bromo domain-containing protein n=1 Tax=Ilex paraguariensis TaxID=185542 RepID=A0ABC8TYZ4_9AQUA
MGEESMVVGPNSTRWGTWEELILGGAVLRHGTQDWNVVALELQARTIYIFTPEACKAKYEQLQKHYSGCSVWFEELRKRRVAELKRDLEKSEDSIGSLKSKLESLKTEREHYDQVEYGSSQTESPVPILKSEGIEFWVKETSKDGLSAGSFTQDAQTNWSLVCQIPPVESNAEMERKPEFSGSCEHENLLCIKKPGEANNEQEGPVRKRRGKRKRKDCKRAAKEGSIGESDNVGSTNVASTSQCKEISVSDCGRTIRSSGLDSDNKDSYGVRSDDLLGIFYSVAVNDNALVFRHKLDSQKRARYRKIIKQHMDFDTIRSRIASGSIKSAGELFRDLLLLANNALVFYSKRTREYKTALALRDIFMKANQKRCKDTGNKASSSILYMSPLCNPPVKPRSFRPHPCKRTLSAKFPNAENVTTEAPQGYQKPVNDDSNLLLQSLVMVKKGLGRPMKIGHGIANRHKNPMKDRKRVRQR